MMHLLESNKFLPAMLLYYMAASILYGRRSGRAAGEERA